MVDKKKALQPNPNWARLPLFDRKGWKRMAFGQFADSVNERVEPADAAEEIYVGLDDLDSGSLHIRRWGKGSDVIGTKLRFRKGDIVFGRRRAYQRKLAVAEVDGICSAHAMVVRAKPAVVLPEFLPFLMMSNKFMKRAVEISVGSLSPTINWTTLKLEEFDLPPLDQQCRIAEILWAVDETVVTGAENLTALSSLKQVAMEEYTLLRKPIRSGRADKAECPMRQLGQVAAFQYGLSCPLKESGDYPILRMMNYDEELVAATDMKFADMPAEVATEFEVRKGDILFNRTNSADLVGKVGIFTLDGCYLFASYLVRVQTNRTVLLPEFLNYYLNSPHGQNAVRAFATPGVSQSNISAGNLKKVEVPVPSIRQQETAIEELNRIAAAKRTCRSHESTQRALLLNFINVILGEQP